MPTLRKAIAPNDQTFDVVGDSLFGSSYAYLDAECIFIESVGDTTGGVRLGVLRGVNGTIRAAHLAGTPVLPVLIIVQTADLPLPPPEELGRQGVQGIEGPPGTVPTGGIVLWSATVPAGFLPCDGSLVGRTTYADLFGVIGTTFGEGDGTTTFGLPDIKGVKTSAGGGPSSPPSITLPYIIKT